MQLTGTVYRILDTEVFSEKFSMRLLVIKTDDDKYPQTIPIEFANKAIAKLENLQIGQRVIVEINIRGREWQSKKSGEVKFYSSISGWRVTPESRGGDSYPPQQQGGGGGQPDLSGNDDDIPFRAIYEV